MFSLYVVRLTVDSHTFAASIFPSCIAQIMHPKMNGNRDPKRDQVRDNLARLHDAGIRVYDDSAT